MLLTAVRPSSIPENEQVNDHWSRHTQFFTVSLNHFVILRVGCLCQDFQSEFKLCGELYCISPVTESLNVNQLQQWWNILEFGAKVTWKKFQSSLSQAQIFTAHVGENWGIKEALLYFLVNMVVLTKPKLKFNCLYLGLFLFLLTMTSIFKCSCQLCLEVGVHLWADVGSCPMNLDFKLKPLEKAVILKSECDESDD